MGQTNEKPSSPQQPFNSIVNRLLSPETSADEEKSGTSQTIDMALKWVQLLAIPLIEATKSVSRDIAEASDKLDPFGMKEAQRTIRWQQEVIQAQHKEILKLQQKEIDRLQTELKKHSSDTDQTKKKKGAKQASKANSVNFK